LRRELDAPPEELPEAERAEEVARTAQLHDEVKRRVAAEPGVAAVAFASRVAGMNHPYEALALDPQAPSPADAPEDPGARVLSVDPDYFSALGAPIVAGRAFRPADAEAGESVIVNETFVREVMNGRNPVGQRIRYPKRLEGEGERWYEVVGVVRDLEMDAFGPGAHAAAYHPLTPGRASSLQMFVRIDSPGRALGSRLRSTITSVDPSLRLGELVTVRALWAPDHESRTFFAAMQGVVALIGLLLSMAGIHALMAFTVSQRTREI